MPNCYKPLFLSFFLGWRIPKLITGLGGNVLTEAPYPMPTLTVTWQSHELGGLWKEPPWQKTTHWDPYFQVSKGFLSSQLLRWQHTQQKPFTERGFRVSKFRGEIRKKASWSNRWVCYILIGSTHLVIALYRPEEPSWCWTAHSRKDENQNGHQNGFFLG